MPVILSEASSTRVPGVGDDVPALNFLDVEPAVRPGETHGRNLQHGVDILVETTGFEIDYDGEEAAKSGAHFAHRRPCKPRGQAFRSSIQQLTYSDAQANTVVRLLPSGHVRTPVDDDAQTDCGSPVL